MKKILCLCLMALLGMSAKAQEQDDAKQHLDFFGVSIEGTIDSISNHLQPTFRLKKKNGAENNYIFEGPMFGHNVYVQAYYSRKSRTAYRMVVTPGNVSQEVWKDSLVQKYGDPAVTEQGLLWQRPGGMILYYAPEGYGSVVIYLDAKGNEAYIKEK